MNDIWIMQKLVLFEHEKIFHLDKVSGFQIILSANNLCDPWTDMQKKFSFFQTQSPKANLN